MLHPFLRTEFLLGKEGMEKLYKSKVQIFGVGGVGGYVVEALARSGVGHIIIVDKDVVDITNVNRQIPALQTTVGQAKVDVLAERVKQINPEIIIETYHEYANKDNMDEILQKDVDYVVDAIDNITSKILLIEKCKEYNIPIMSSMGAGNKLNPTKLEVADIFKTSICPMAKVMRHELKRRGVKKLKVVYSKEKPITPQYPEAIQKELEGQRKKTPGSTAFTPAVAGLIIASEVVKDLSGIRGDE